MPQNFPLALLAVGFGGAVGAIARFLVSLWARRLFPDYAPLGTLLVNVVGCLLIGYLGTLAMRSQLSPELKLLLVTGGLGSLTTFSTFGYETLEYVTDFKRWDLAALNVALNLLLGLAAVAAGRQIALWSTAG
ncbi:fluoride efflux transporter CrcB [Stratiformator vulcanicus]|uniref:Fluoride-specific ion channel FluC n=1 Tax=Stratiformator vulcanicus TaxID=2527980 RepID=A0A517QY25_9PLAN|nr:fluoride efflux transporter CrcB [Stratiformator vulcanicus]QDT36514.1 Putative fluoride ion transporter CrcB [Stratiformator vulcanicus]